MISEFTEVKVMYVKSDKGALGSSQAFDRLESKLPTLKGRKFYGLIFGVPPKDEYWASVELVANDQPDQWGFQTGSIPAGTYIQERINDWDKDVSIIGKTFHRLMRENKIDTSRPCVEFYRSMRDMLVRLPVT